MVLDILLWKCYLKHTQIQMILNQGCLYSESEYSCDIYDNWESKKAKEIPHGFLKHVTSICLLHEPDI